MFVLFKRGQGFIEAGCRSVEIQKNRVGGITYVYKRVASVKVAKILLWGLTDFTDISFSLVSSLS